MSEKEMITYHMERHIGIISENPNSGWTTELNLISWNGKPAKLDLRSWSPDHTKMGKGLTGKRFTLVVHRKGREKGSPRSMSQQG